MRELLWRYGIRQPSCWRIAPGLIRSLRLRSGLGRFGKNYASRLIFSAICEAFIVIWPLTCEPERAEP